MSQRSLTSKTRLLKPRGLKTTVKAPTTPAQTSNQSVLDAYTNITSKYHRSVGGRNLPDAFNKPLFGKGFHRVTDMGALQTRVGGFDKLFNTLVQGIVEDPDYAVRKDNQIYERMKRDPQIFYCLMVRKAATAGLNWSVRPPDDHEKDPRALEAAQAAERRIKQIPMFSELLDNILDALLPGLSVNELVWKINAKGEYVVAKHFPMNKDRFVFDKSGNLRLRVPTAATTGIQLPSYKFIQHTYNISDGSWREPENAGYIYFGKGLADTPLYHYFYFKMTALKFYLQSLERAGAPAKVIYTGAQNAALANKLHEIMLALKNDSVVAIPGKRDETRVEVIKQPSSAQLFSNFIDYVDRLITRAILGQDLMTEMPSSHGSYAAASVHQSVFSWIALGDQKLLKYTLNATLMKFDAALNTPDLPEELRPILDFKQSSLEDPSTFITSVNAGIEMGLEVSESQVRESLGLREPKDGEGTISLETIAAIKQSTEPQPIPGQEPQPGQNSVPGTSKPPQSQLLHKSVQKVSKSKPELKPVKGTVKVKK